MNDVMVQVLLDKLIEDAVNNIDAAFTLLQKSIPEVKPDEIKPFKCGYLACLASIKETFEGRQALHKSIRQVVREQEPTP